MTEADTKDIWSLPDQDDTIFGKIGVRIAELLNFAVYRDATHQCTNTAVMPLFEQLSEEILIELFNARKVDKFSDVYAFVNTNVVRIASRVIRANMWLIREIQLVEGQRYIITTSNDLELPGSDQGLIKRTTS